MNMKSKFSRLFAARFFALAAVGCGAPGEPFDDEQLVEGQLPELGQLELELSAATRGTNIGYGIQPGNSHNACRTDISGQECLVPKKKTFSWCATGVPGTTTAEEQDINDVMSFLNNGNTGFTWVHATDDSTADPFRCLNDIAAGITDIQINTTVTCPGTCSRNSSIFGCACLNLTPGTALTESLPGTYRTINRHTIVLDRPAINSSGMSASALRLHAVAKHFLAVAGLGGTTDIPELITHNIADDSVLHASMLTSQLCQMQSFSVSNPTTWAYSGTCN